MGRVIRPVRRIRGEIRVPGDKSISHRALMLASIAHGESSIDGLAPSSDVTSTARCLRELGASMDAQSETACRIEGRSRSGLQAPQRELDAGNSGTTLRLLSGLLAGQPFQATITGDASLRRRPMGRIIDPLNRMGVRVHSNDGCAPLVVHGGEPQGMRYELPVASAQVKSCLLLAGLYADDATTVVEPEPTRDHTERMLRAMGADIGHEDDAVTLRGCRELDPLELSVPGDLSSAAFFLAAASVVPDGELTLRHIGVNPTRTGILDVLRSMGAPIEVLNEREQGHEPIADLQVDSASALRGTEIDGSLVPRLIDEIPLLAVLATQAAGCTVIRDAAELRHKETDRIHAVAENLRHMGADLDERHDGLVIEGPQRLRGAHVASFRDHRIAMAFAIASLVADGPTTIDGADWTDVSFPSFFDTLQQVAQT
ncbi:MAG: 3-phosphoshikimate 1-carboxyvinyltransferase [Candidatus Bipolaricaulia bacterium]